MNGLHLRRVLSIWVVTATIVFSILYAQQSSPVKPADATSIIESFRVVGGLAGMALGLLSVIFGITGAVAYWNVGKQTNQNKALNDTVGIYENKITALELHVRDLTLSNTGLIARIQEKDKILTDLQNKTDLSRVLEMFTASATHNETQRMEGIKMFTDAMKMQRDDFAKEFSKVITKFAGIEACINSLCDKLGVTQEARNGHLGRLSRDAT